MRSESLSQILRLDIPDRIELVEEIWDSIADHPESLPITDSQREELDRRLSRHRQNPRSGSPWHSVRERIAKHK